MKSGQLIVPGKTSKNKNQIVNYVFFSPLLSKVDNYPAGTIPSKILSTSFQRNYKKALTRETARVKSQAYMKK